MTTVKRLISGFSAGWANIGVQFISQLAATPIYLTYWTTEQYGVWIAFLALLALFQAIDFGHHTYLHFEFLRIGVQKKDKLLKVFSSSLPIAFMIGLCMVIVASVDSVFYRDQDWSISRQVSKEFDKSLEFLLLVNVAVYAMFGSVLGLGHRLLSAFGYYSRFAWWGVVLSVLQIFIPLLMVISGGNLFSVAIAYAFCRVAVGVGIYFDYFRLFRRHQLAISRPNVFLGLRNFGRSLWLTTKSLLDFSRQQGTRLILASLVGATSLVTFTTLRTGANVALQGLTTITNPLMPELMRFLNQKDQTRSESAFGTVWLVVVGAMAPAVVLVQAFIEPAFTWWTRGKIEFDPLLFGTLSAGVLVFALAQPAMAVVQGNNLLRIQLVFSVLAGGIAVAGMLILVPLIGIRGAACALLMAEVASAFGYVAAARTWLNSHGMSWPSAAFIRVSASVIVACCAIVGMVLSPAKKLEIIGITLIIQLILLFSYWRQLPMFARNRAKDLVARSLPIRFSTILRGQENHPQSGTECD